jgi:hypothetical protein
MRRARKEENCEVRFSTVRRMGKPAADLAAGSKLLIPYFFAARIFAHLFRCAAAIFLRAEADIVCFTGAALVVFAAPAAGCDPFRARAHLAFCASAIFRREAADMIRFGCFAWREVPEPSNDSIAEIACPNLSTSNCALPYSARSC